MESKDIESEEVFEFLGNDKFQEILEFQHIIIFNKLDLINLGDYYSANQKSIIS